MDDRENHIWWFIVEATSRQTGQKMEFVKKMAMAPTEEEARRKLKYQEEELLDNVKIHDIN